MQYHHLLQIFMVDYRIYHKLSILACSIITAFILYASNFQQDCIDCMKVFICTFSHALTVNFNIFTNTILQLVHYLLTFLCIKTDQMVSTFSYIRFSYMMPFVIFVYSKKLIIKSYWNLNLFITHFCILGR